jgi:hypothetical protein
LPGAFAQRKFSSGKSGCRHPNESSCAQGIGRLNGCGREKKTALGVRDRDDDGDQHCCSARDGGTGGNVRRQIKKAFRSTTADSETPEKKESFADADRHITVGERNAGFFAKRNFTAVDHAVAICERYGDRAAKRNSNSCSVGG